MIGLLFCLYFSSFLMLSSEFIISPILFLFFCCSLLFSSRFRKTAIYGLVAYDISFVVGSLVILTDDGSTAGVGFIFLPAISLVPGAIAFLFHDILSNNKNNAS